MIYFTADTHFGHANIIKFCNRPFSDVHEMNEYMIAAWNERVCDNDTVFIIGDMFFKSDINPEETLFRLKGKKRLIIGNHDHGWLQKINPNKFFEAVDNYYEYCDNGKNFVLCHFPLLTYRHEEKWYMIHGHIHNNTDFDFWPLLKARPLVLNAGVEVNNYMPVTFDELVANNERFKSEH